jgi:hypothetical protein
MNVDFDPAHMEFEVSNRATMYRLIRVAGLTAHYFLVETGWHRGSGEWIRLADDSVSWDYVVEKMPGIARNEGDKEGWVKLFAAAGIEVFG